MPTILPPAPPSAEYQVVLQKPFSGDVALKRVEIIGEPNRDGQIKVTERTGPNNQTFIVHEGHIDTEDSRQLFHLVEQVRGFPTNPDKDIYGLDARLAFTSDMQFDSGGDESTGELTEETKDTFKGVVDSIEALARMKAKQPART